MPLKGERTMEQFDLRRRVAERSTPPLFAVPVTLVDPAIVEIVGFAGAEAMIIDAEHGTIGPETMRLMLAHARSTGIAAIYRPRSFDASLCRQALDMGAAGIHVPHVDTAEQARAIVQACRYPPLGHRQLGLARAIEYDVSKLRPYVARANESQLLVIMIESAEGLAKVEEISAVRGIDVIHVGTGDLSHDMGLTGQPLHAEVDAAVERIIEV